jgi:hypothetical protein
MRQVLVIICTTVLIAGCKPAERTPEESRARFEAKTIDHVEKTAQSATASERHSLEATFEQKLSTLDTKTDELAPKIRLSVEPNRTTLDTDSANLRVRIAATKKELAAAKAASADEWATTRSKLERDIADMERELDSLTKRVG